MYGTYDRDVHTFIDTTSALPDIQAYNLAAGDISGSLVFDVIEPITVTRIGVVVTTALVTTTDPVIAVDRRVLYASDTGRVELDQVTIPTTTPAGTVVKVDINPVNCDVGDQLVPQCITQGVGSAGNYKIFFCYHHRAETTGNQSEQSDSA